MPRRGSTKTASAGNGKSLSDEMYDEIEQLHRSKTEDGIEGSGACGAAPAALSPPTDGRAQAEVTMTPR